jgi:hypothetical protein
MKKVELSKGKVIALIVVISIIVCGLLKLVFFNNNLSDKYSSTEYTTTCKFLSKLSLIFKEMSNCQYKNIQISENKNYNFLFISYNEYSLYEIRGIAIPNKIFKEDLSDFSAALEPPFKVDNYDYQLHPNNDWLSLRYDYINSHFSNINFAEIYYEKLSNTIFYFISTKTNINEKI